MALKVKLAKLQKDVLLSQKLLEKEEEIEKIQLKSLKQYQNFQNKINQCEQLVMNISDLNYLITDQKKQLLKLQFLLESRQLYLISRLADIYPITKSHSNSATSSGGGGLGEEVFTIRGVELNEHNITYRNDDNIETALGYLSHLLQLISKYLELPLRYQILYYASRSMIRDCIAIPAIVSFSTTSFTNGVVLPLYRRGVEKER
jgi:hypothetical protein